MPEEEPQIGKIERETSENLTTVETENATYRILYGAHIFRQEPEALGDVDAVILESILSGVNTHNDAFLALQKMQRSPQYNEVISDCLKNERPIFITDIQGTRSFWKDLKQSVGIETVESIAAAGLTLSAALDVAKTREKSMTRRQFLKIGGKLIAASYLGLPFISDHITAAPYNPESSSVRRLDKRLKTIAERIHPEVFGEVLTLRNNVIAQKSEIAAKMLGKELGHKPKIALLLGMMHSGIEQSLKRTEDERLTRIRRQIGNDMMRHARILRYDFEPSKEKGKKTIQVSFLEDPKFFEK